MRNIKKILFFFLAVTAFLSIMQFTVPDIIGFDGYFHIKLSEVIRENGFVHNIGAEHTILADNYADMHILFRILLMPFTFMGLTLGAKIASILFSGAALAFFYWFLLQNKIRYPLFWSLVYMFASAELMRRFLLPRQMQLAVVLLILTIYFMQQRKYFLLGLVSMAYSLYYSAFVIQIFVILIYVAVNLVYARKLDYKLLLYSFGGSLVGLIVNPYFPANLSLLYTQIFKVNILGNLYNVEWKPWPFLDFMKFNVIALSSIFASVILLFRRKKIKENSAFYLVLTLFFLAYTLITRRMHEYLIPFSVILIAFVCTGFSVKIYDDKYLKSGAILFLVIFGTYNAFTLGQNIIEGNFLHNYDKCTGWMVENIPKNSKVFNNAYAFPYLFFKNADLRYTHGLDLTYSYLHDKEEFERYMGILEGTIRTDTDWIQVDYTPDYVFVGKIEQDKKLFDFILSNKQNYRVEYEDGWCAVLRVV